MQLSMGINNSLARREPPASLGTIQPKGAPNAVSNTTMNKSMDISAIMNKLETKSPSGSVVRRKPAG